MTCPALRNPCLHKILAAILFYYVAYSLTLPLHSLCACSVMLCAVTPGVPLEIRQARAAASKVSMNMVPLPCATEKDKETYRKKTKAIGSHMYANPTQSNPIISTLFFSPHTASYLATACCMESHFFLAKHSVTALNISYMTSHCAGVLNYFPLLGEASRYRGYCPLPPSLSTLLYSTLLYSTLLSSAVSSFLSTFLSFNPNFLLPYFHLSFLSYVSGLL